MPSPLAIHVFGEVLFDHFPDGSQSLGGAPFNVAWNIKGFARNPHFISRVGDDSAGRQILDLMDRWGMDHVGVQIDSQHATGSVQVIIEDGEPCYDIVANCAYDFINAAELSLQDKSGILYHGSLATRNPQSAAALQAIRARHNGKVFVDVNLRSPWWTPKTLFPLLHGADWVKLNEAELYQLCPDQTQLEKAIQQFCRQFALDKVFVTLGERGAITYQNDGQIVTVEPSPNLHIVDTVGAGDAFASVLLTGLSENWPLEVMLERAQAFAGEVVGKRGATVVDSGFYRACYQRW